ncbi:uncharacterized protein LOC129900421 [Solanum dulcamara]|uniref:uncharacterized protein LOC129900421 n=1 Tax=Solanum dulcamara TaxID=45834 RepID=UPI002485573B|nr:uncharacterized protein LOC129900421 [Solanum dulcamara]XP_055831371.1 uncharacterized protein LOC129900421 [Solanum dulcamara]
MEAETVMRKEAAAEVITGTEAKSAPVKTKMNEVELVKCECCGLTEDCTVAYIGRVRERNEGRWICGLCAEAVKDEIMRSSERRIGREEALNRHMNFCSKFRALTPPPNRTDELISAVKQLMLRSLDSPRSSPVRRQGLVRSQSCFSVIDS